MANDKRAFALFDVGYLDNPKMMNVLDASPNAVLMHAASVLYCAQHLTDGVIALRAMQRKVGGTAADSELLIEEGLWHVPGHDCPTCPEVPEGKAYVHDYLEHNRSSDGVKGKSAAGSKAATARWAKAKTQSETDAERMRTALPDAVPGAVQNAMPKKEREKEDKSISSGPADAEPRPDVEKLLDLMDECLTANGSKAPARTKRNRDAARLLLDRDGYTAEQVSWMIRWATSDEFWRVNILSMSKLREKFERLKAQATGHRQVMTLEDWRKAHEPSPRQAEVDAWLEANPDPTW